MKKEKSNTKRILTTILVLALLTAGITAVCILVTHSDKTVFYDNPSANGNTAGNLYNDGLFATADGKVYFSNPYDKGCLYVMDEDETHAEKLSAETVYSLNVYKDYIYYCKNDLNDSNSTSVLRGALLGAARCDLNGSNILELNDRYTGSLVLVGNTLLFQDFENNRNTDRTTCQIQSVGIDGKNKKLVWEHPIEIAGVAGSQIYYSGTEDDHNLYILNPKTNHSSVILEGNCWMPLLFQSGGSRELYYIDLSDSYALVRTSPSEPDKKEVVVSRRISSYNVSDTYIYFQIDDQENSCLCRIRRDATTDDYEVVKEGNYENINITPNYVYFNQFDNRSLTYRTPVDGSVRVQEFSDAVSFNSKK